MADATNDLRVLLANIPRESLDLELKQWIDPKKNEGIAKIAKGCIALRNHNGGRLVIGIKDDGSPDTNNVPSDVRSAFHVDVIQAIVSKYSSEQFAVEVQFVDVGSQLYPVIVVPPGVRTPVAAKSTLNGSDKKPLVSDHVVHVRSLHSNNTVSSTEARRGDWETLTRICFDNREADIGGFVRRHLAALNLEALAEMISSLRSLKHPSEVERVTAELDRGRSRFDAEVKKRGVHLPPLGFRESTILVDGEFPKQDTTQSFRGGLLFRAPRHTSWPPWVEIDREPHRPYVFENGWEALLMDLNATRSPRPEVDFWRIEPQGIFYQIRALEDDLSGDIGPTPRTQLDFLLQISRIAEIISTGLSFGRSLGCDEETTSLVFGFRWTGLEGRQLTSWADPRRRIYQLGEARQDQITTTVTVPLMTPPNGVAPHVENAVRSLFTRFGGTVFESNVVEGIVSEALQRRW